MAREIAEVQTPGRRLRSARARRLATRRRSVPRLPEEARNRPERMLEERFAALAVAGELTAPDPRLAARHFTALTIGLVLESINESDAERPAVEAIIAAGADAFLRAYAR